MGYVPPSQSSINTPGSGAPVRNTPVDGSTGFLLAMNYERGEEFGMDDYLQIGDSVFHVPPLSISVVDTTNNHAEDVLRTPGGIVMANGFAEKRFTISLMFTSCEEIYGLPKTYHSTAASRQVSGGYLGPPIEPGSFAALIAQFTRTPVLPVVNHFINYTHGTYALALEALIVQTSTNGEGMPLPNTLTVTLSAKAFSIGHMCPGLTMFDDAIIYPLQRWFWQQHYSLKLPGQYVHYTFNPVVVTPVYPHQTGMTGSFQFLTIDRNWTNAIETLRNEFSQKLNYSQTTQFRTRTSMDDQASYNIELKQLSDKIIRLSSENNARLIPWDFGSELILTGITAQMKNNFTPLRIPDAEFPTYQHMSTGDVHLSATFTAVSERAVSQFQAMVSEARSLARDVRFETIAGFIGFENEIVSLMGVHSVVFTDLQVTTLPGFPNTFSIALEMIAFDRMQRRLESVQSSQDVPQYYLDQVPATYGQDLLDAQGGDPTDPQVAFWSRYRQQKDPSLLGSVPSGVNPYDNSADTTSATSTDSNTGASTTAGLPGLDPTGRPTNAWFNMAYIQEALEQQSALELYPDLQLPTFNRLKQALSTGEIFTDTAEQSLQLLVQELRWRFWGDEGKFIDPDFYVDYPNDALAKKIATANQTQGSVGNPASYLNSALASSNGVNPLEIIGMNFSVSSFLSQSLFDNHPAVTALGPDFVQAATRSGESGWDRGQIKAHMHGKMPSPTTNTTSIMQSGLNSSLLVDASGNLVDTASNAGVNLVNQDISHASLNTIAGAISGEVFGNTGSDISPSPFSNTGNNSNSTATSNTGKGAGGPFGGSSGAPSFEDTLIINGQTYNFTHANDSSTGAIADFTSYSKLTADTSIPGNIANGIKEVGGTGDTGPQINSALMAHHPIDIGSTVNDEHGRLIAMCNDVLTFDVTGRLVQAYPSYVFQLIDEGPRLGWVKIFPNFFALQAITSIDVIADRREPADTAIIELMNTYGNVSSYTALQLAFGAVIAMDRASLLGEPAINNLIGDITQSLTVAGNPSAPSAGQIGQNLEADFILYKEGIQNAISSFIPDQNLIENTVMLRQKQSGQIMLAPGVRCHIRMGYGANGGRLPLVFNGRITDIGYGERMRIIAQGDGTELANLIPTAESETNSINRPDRSFLQTSGADVFAAFTDLFLHLNVDNAVTDIKNACSHLTEMTYEPRELICNMLNSHGEDLYDYGLGTKFWNLCKSTLWASTNGAMFQDNPIGISHFGNPYLFNLWGAIAKTSFDSADTNYGTPQELASYQKVATLAASPQATIPQVLLAASKAGIDSAANPNFDPSNAGPEAILNLGNTFTNLGTAMSNTPGSSSNSSGVTALGLGLSGFAIKMVGEAATLLTHNIPVGFGETGENVYSIYTPFSVLCQQAGTFFSEGGLQALQTGFGVSVSGQITTLQGAASTAAAVNNTTDVALPDLTSGIGHTPLAGAHPPGVTFNMYTKNKRVWDVCTTMAQYFPPYIVAARPFEYRSTLFFGAPYFQYRWSYQRVSAYQLGNQPELDLYYGYPYAYNVKTFAQYHYYDSQFNLLDDDIRASDEDTFTDVIAMWYKGQGFSGDRPTPMPTHQTVDRQIAPALRKTAIINTDVVGLDTAPTGAAILGSAGGALLGYWFEHFAEIPGTDIGVHGAANFFITEQNMRNMARAMLRDYQKLMYQGHILVIGDPTVKPHDLMYINDGYLDIKGGASVRRVIHHFGFETGFVTSIEPDLLVDVKGQDFILSYWQWLFGFVSMDLAAFVSSKMLLQKGTLKFVENIFRFGSKFGANKLIKKIPTRTFLYNLRNIFLNGVGKVISKNKTTQATIQEITDGIIEKFKSTTGRIPFGDGTLDVVMRQEAEAQLYEIINTGFAGLPYEDTVIAEAINAIPSMTKLQVEEFAAQVANNSVIRNGLIKYITRGGAIINWGELEASVQASFKTLAGILSEKGAGNAAATASSDAILALGEKLIPAIFRGIAIGRFAVGGIVGLVIQVAIGAAWTGISRWWDDQTSLQMSFLQYHGIELQAGLNGHSDSIVFRTGSPDNENLTMTADQLKYARQTGQFQLRPDAESAITYLATPTNTPATNTPGSVAQQNDGGGSGPDIKAPNPTSPLSSTTGSYTTAQRQAIAQIHISQNGSWYGSSQSDFVDPNIVTDGLVKIFDLMQSAGIYATVYVFKTGHRNNGGDHPKGKAADIVNVNKSDIGNTMTPQIQAFLNFLISPVVYALLHQYGLDGALNVAPYINYGKYFNDTPYATGPHIHIASLS